MAAMTTEQKTARDAKHRLAADLARKIEAGTATPDEVEQAVRLERAASYSCWSACLRMALEKVGRWTPKGGRC